MVSSSVSNKMKTDLTDKEREKPSWDYASPLVWVINSAICMLVAPPHEGVLDFVYLEVLRHLCLGSGTLSLLIIFIV